VIREPRKSDQGYVTSTWIRSIMRGTHVIERHGLARSGQQLHGLIDKLMDRPDTKALLRVKPSDPDVIHAWLMYTEGQGVPVIHFVYTRADERQRGFAGELLHRIGVRRDGEAICTSDGPSSAMVRSLYPGVRYVPLANFLRPGGV
jgi:hypothetical protein